MRNSIVALVLTRECALSVLQVPSLTHVTYTQIRHVHAHNTAVASRKPSSRRFSRKIKSGRNPGFRCTAAAAADRIALLCVPHTASDVRFSSPWRGGSRVAGPGGRAQVSRCDSNPPHTRACARTRHPPTRMRPLLTTHTRAQQVHPPLPPPRRRPDTSPRHGSRRRRFSVATVIAIAATPAAAAPATATPAACHCACRCRCALPPSLCPLPP